ncbi:MAG: thiamine-phosphate kinase [Bacteroidales bacterium]
MSITQISSLGEFGLIDRLTKDVKLTQPSTYKGIGDDCAILHYGADTEIVVTTDLLMEGIHFDLLYCPLKHLGYKAVAVNLSDIYAMNATPKQITVSIAVSKKFSVEALEQLYEGIVLACNRFEVDLVGGDTSSSLTGLAISITAIGETKKGESVLRSGAKENDLICVSGDLGAAYLGLQVLEREKHIFKNAKGISPKLEGYDYVLERQLKPEPRRDIITALKRSGIKPTSMIDISDGLSSEILHICKQSDKGCKLYLHKFPIHDQTKIIADEFNVDVYTCALNGGEDYELLFTVDIKDYNKVVGIPDVTIIGNITNKEQGTFAYNTNGDAMKIQSMGWQSFKHE